MHCLGIAQSLNWSVASCFSAAREGSQCQIWSAEAVKAVAGRKNGTVGATPCKIRKSYTATCTGPSGEIVQVGQAFNTDSGPSYLCTDDGPEMIGKRTSCSTPFVETAVGCIYVNTATVDWTTARQQCTALGSDLYTADTHEQFEAMRMYILSTNSSTTLAGLWVAIKKVGNTWMWSPSGRSPGPDYTGDWASTDPNGAQFNQQCARMMSLHVYRLGDTGCESLYSFVCHV
ncbi:C-type lectin domain family 4 member C [Hyalella azteca]|uniref:C-type lectin domain family 4 member C n=1 Tax=Hyalella azteca TaxID=294128 RepID=A0A8B7PBA9_HYAAZ|nr:C-type lectin domain family 4 member C [Hyalella azteca]